MVESGPADLRSLARQLKGGMILIGPADAAGSALEALRAGLATPVVECDCGKPLGLPPDASTVILRDVARLAIGQQRDLLQWMEAHVGRVLIIAVATDSLYPLVARGTFLDTLFYRLNVVTLGVDDFEPHR
jgi:hypothetical protein